MTSKSSARQMSHFREHIQSKMKSCNRIICVIKKLSPDLSRDLLLRIFKPLFRQIIDYGDIIYNKPNIESFKNETESIQCKVCIAIKGSIQSESKEHLYQDLVLKTLSDRYMLRTYFTKYIKSRYTLNYQTRTTNKNTLKKVSYRTEKSKLFKYS